MHRKSTLRADNMKRVFFVMSNTCRAISQVIRHWLLIVQTRIRSQATSCESSPSSPGHAAQYHLWASSQSLWGEQLRNRSSIPGRARENSLFHGVYIGYTTGAVGSFPGSKADGA
jgi:hypothetical protein